MKLSDLEAAFVKYIPRPPTAEERADNPQMAADRVIDCFRIEGVSFAEADGLLFICPKSRAAGKDHYLQVYFHGGAVPERLGKNKDGKTVRWTKRGTCIEDLVLTPSIQEQDDGSCGWHGFVGGPSGERPGEAA
jgi:hypothetical protein